MTKLNENYLKLQANYLFIDIANKVKAFTSNHPNIDIIRMGIGDVTRPLPPAVVEAMKNAADEMKEEKTFRGYGPEQGYPFLQEAIIKNDYLSRNINILPEELFINDGAKSDTGNIGDIFSIDNTICVTDPIYPVYIDSNVMCGRAGNLTPNGWSNIVYVPCNSENHFVPELPHQHVDIIYLCYPNNPTGTVLTRSQLNEWVKYALDNGSIILYDSAYEAFICEDDVPHSIYEIEGARHCAIEFRSFSKTAGFTGVRCGYTVIPNELVLQSSDNLSIRLNRLWARRQGTKYNGTSYITQRGAEAIYSPQGQQEIKANIDYYMRNAEIMRNSLIKCGLEVIGGVNAPYIWVKTPDGMSSWEFFDRLLQEVHIVCTPGVGFGPSGEGYIRFTAFGTREQSIEAMYRISTWI